MTSAVKGPKRYVYICTGPDCSEDKKKLRNLKKTLGAEAKIKFVKCQKICNGPVAGTMINGTITWFEHLATAKHRESFLRFLQTGKANKTLRKHEHKQRVGKLR